MQKLERSRDKDFKWVYGNIGFGNLFLKNKGLENLLTNDVKIVLIDVKIVLMVVLSY